MEKNADLTVHLYVPADFDARPVCKSGVFLFFSNQMAKQQGPALQGDAEFIPFEARTMCSSKGSSFLSNSATATLLQQDVVLQGDAKSIRLAVCHSHHRA